jgi:hypothetical protein
MLPQTLDAAARTGMGDAEMACALRQTGAQGALVFGANGGLAESQMARAIGHAALRVNFPFHVFWTAVLGNPAWPAEKTLMMCLVSKGMRQLVKELRTPAWVSRNALFWRAPPDARTRSWHKKWDRNWWPPVMGGVWPFGTHGKIEFVLRHMKRLAEEVNITQLRIPHARMVLPSHFLRLATGLFHCRDIRVLNLKKIQVGRGRGIEFLVMVLPFMSTLTDLNLSRNRIDALGADTLTAGVGKCTSLEILNLNDNEIFRNREANELHSDVIFGNLYTCVNLRRLCLRSNGVGHMQIAAILEWLSTFTPRGWLLADLNVAYGDLDRPAVELLMLVATVSPLEQLNLCECDIRDIGTRQLADGLASATRLTHLCLSVNRITDRGAYRLARVLSTCVSLQCLDVSGNAMRVEGAQALADATWNCSTLTHLLLSDNAFDGRINFPPTSNVEYFGRSYAYDAPMTLHPGMKY